MTAIFTGLGAGFARGSGSVLGSAGLLGSASTGRSGANLMVNAATGNLLINRQDEFLTGPSHDISISRTYNSLAEVHDGDNGDKWQMGTVRKVFGLTGTLNAAGSTVKRQAGDGSVSTYQWSTRGGVAAYWSTDGDGAHEKLVNAAGVWTWTDGASQFSEVYEAIPGDSTGWRIASYKDSAGAALTFSYISGTKLNTIQAASGEYIRYIWSGNNITQIDNTIYSATAGAFVPWTRTRYEYDGSGRLSAVKVDLSPDSPGIADGHFYATTYQYNAAGLISAVIQTDGSRTDIAYDAAGRVTHLKETVGGGETRTTRIGYGANMASVTTPNDEVTRLWYDAKGQLVQIMAPPATKGGVSQVRQFEYDSDGNLLRTIETDSVNAGIPDNLVLAGSWGDGEEADRGDNLVDDSGWAHDVDGTLPPNGSLGAGWTSYYTGETEWTVTSGPYSGNVASLHAGQSDTGDSGGGAQTNSFTIDHTKAYEFTLYVKADQLDKHRIYFGLYGDVKNGWDGSTNTNPYFTYEFPNAATGMQANKWYKMVAYVLPSSVGLESAGTYGGLYDVETGAKVRDIYHFIWNGSANSAQTRFFNYYSQANQGKFTHFYKPEVREVADVAILRNGAKLDIVKDRNLVETPYAAGWNNVPWANGDNEARWNEVVGPDGSWQTALQTGQFDAVSDGGGGYTNQFTIDPTKTYRFTQYFRKSDLSRHYLYFGLSGHSTAYVKQAWDGAANTNPYFLAMNDDTQRSLLQEDRWYKVVGYVLPQGSANIAYSSLGGIYDATTGARVADVSNFRWNETRPDNQVHARFFTYYDETQHGWSTDWLAPEVVQVANATTDHAKPFGVTYDEGGRITSYLYDAMGNVAQVTAPVGSYTQRWYDSRNRVTVEGSYGSNEFWDQVSHYTRYAYDSYGRLRYRVGPEGRVTEYSYDAQGRILNEIAYLKYTHPVADTPITEAGMTAWRDGLADKTRRSIKSYGYDGRGNVSYTYEWSAADANGNANSSAPFTLTYYSYDHLGRLLSTNRWGEQPETYYYDGLNRIVASSSPSTGVTSVFFDDANTRTVIHTASGLNRTLTYNKAGDLISEIESSLGTPSTPSSTDLAAYSLAVLTRTQVADIAGRPAYRFDTPSGGTWVGTSSSISADAGSTIRFRFTIKGDGTTTTHSVGLYGYTDGWGPPSNTDTQAVIVSGPGRLTRNSSYGGLWQIDGVSTTTETVVEVVRTFATAQGVSINIYAGAGTVPAGTGMILSAPSLTRVDQSATLNIAAATTTNSYDRLGRLRVSYDEFDNGNRTYFVYDTAGRKTAEVDHYGFVTEYVYDSANRVIGTAKYANNIPASVLTGLLDPNNTLTIAALRPAAHAWDVRNWTIYDAGGRVVQSIDGTGAVTAYQYDGKSRVVRTTVHGTRVSVSGFAANPPTAPVSVTVNAAIDSVTRTFYDRDGNVRGTLDGEGYLVEYVYDGANNKIEEIRYPQAPGLYLGPTASFSALVSYAAPASPDVRRTRFVYDAAGRVRFEVNAQNQVTGYVYHPHNGHLTSKRVYANAISVANYEYATVNTAAVAHANDRVTTYTYDAAGRVVTVVDPAGTATYTTYDQAGRAVKVRHGNNTATEQITRNWYDARGNVRFSVDPAGYLTKYSYTVGGRLSSKQLYDAAVSVSDSTTIVQVAALATGAYTGSSYAYNNDGKLWRVYNHLGELTIYSYHGTGLLYSVDAGYDSSGNTDRSMSVWYYDAAGRVATELTAVGDSEQVARHFQYDALGNRTRVIDGRTISSYASYDRRGLLKTETNGAGGVNVVYRNAFGEVSQVVDARGNLVLTNTYNTLGQLVSAVDPAGTTSYTYTRFGEVLTTTRGGATTSFLYDKMGRVTKITDALTAYEQFTYNEVGDRVSARNKLGGWTTYTYDRRGLKLSEVLPMTSVNTAGTTLATTVTNAYEYDSRGNLTKDTKAVGLPEVNVTVHEYDRANRLIHTIGQAFHGYTPHTYYAYDARGNLTSRIESGNARTVYYYDDLDRVTAEINAVGTYTAYAYDPNGNVTSIKVYTTAVSVPSDGGSQEEAPPPPAGSFRHTTFTYDNANRLETSSVQSVATGNFQSLSWTNTSGALTTTYQYDANGNVVKTTDPNGNATWAWYDALNRKIAQVDGAGYRTTWAYDSEGNVTREIRYAFASGTSQSTTTLPLSPESTLEDRRTDYAYDSMGNRKSERRYWVEINSAGSQSFVEYVEILYNYNGLGQVTLKTEATGETVAYSYDTAGRMTMETKTSFTDHLGGTSTPGTTYAYDGLGNLTRTVQLGNAGAYHRITTYGYDGGKLRWMADAEVNDASIDGSSAEGKQTNYWYDLAGNLQYEYYERRDSNGALANGKDYDGVFRVYDGMGRVTQQWHTAHASGGWNGTGPVTYTTYNAFGEIASTQVGSGALQQNQYDNAGRLIASNAGDGVWKHFAYDKAGNQTGMVVSAGANLAGQTFDSARAMAGAAVTYTRYDGRNLAVSVHEPNRELSATNVQTLVSQRAYNAFGELAWESGADNARIDYTYNHLGRLIRIESPTVTVVGENGASSSVRPTEHRYYDASGRLVAQRDANGNLTRLTLLAGTGYGGSQALVTHETHADGGVKQTKYDVHGDARVLIDELGRQTTQTFDQMGRVIAVAHKWGVTDSYTYDGLGQQLRHWNSFYGSSDAEVTDYDIQGRVVSQRSYGGDMTYTTYTWEVSSLTATAVGSFGGWKRAVDGEGHDATFYSDLFGRDTDAKKQYDVAGRLVLDGVGQPAAAQTRYEYYNTGNVRRIFQGDQEVVNTNWKNRTVDFEYDVLGRLTKEKQVKSHSFYQPASQQVVYPPYNSGPPIYYTIPETYYITRDTIQDGAAEYDALGRMTRYRDGVSQTTPDVDKTWTYDAAGNVRSIVTTYKPMDAAGAISTGTTTSSYWYLYDTMNRVTLSKGTFNGSAVVQGGAGIALGYDATGRRMTSRTGSGGPLETYAYDAHDLVTSVTIGSTVQVTSSYDVLGRINGHLEKTAAGAAMFERYDFVYNSRGQVLKERGRQLQGADWLYTHTVNYYSDTGTGSAGAAIGSIGATGSSSGALMYFSETKNWKNGANPPVYGTPGNYSSADLAWADTYSTYGYQWINKDGQSHARQTTHQLVNRDGTTNSVHDYEADGRLRYITRTTNSGVYPDVALESDAQGLIVRRTETGGSGALPKSRTYRFGGREMGTVGNNGTDNVDYTTSIPRRDDVGTGRFMGGATSGTAFADFDANHRTLAGGAQGSSPGSYTVQPGDTLQAIAASLWGDASLWYKLAETNGLAGAGALAAGQRLLIPNGVTGRHHNAGTFAAYDPARALGDIAPPAATPKPPQGNKCGVFGKIISTVVAVAASYFLGPVIGNVVSQGFNNLIGLQNGFSWKSLGLSVVSAGVASGVGGAMGSGAMFGSQFAGDVIRGAASSAITQGVGVATGMQDKFSWAGVAAAGVGAGIGGAVMRGLSKDRGFFGDGKMSIEGPNGTTITPSKGSWQWNYDSATGQFAGPSFGAQAAATAASTLASAATRSAISGRNFGDSMIAAVPDVVGQTLGGVLGRAMGGSVWGGKDHGGALGVLQDISQAPGKIGVSVGAKIADLIESGVNDIGSLLKYGATVGAREREMTRTNGWRSFSAEDVMAWYARQWPNGATARLIQWDSGPDSHYEIQEDGENRFEFNPGEVLWDAFFDKIGDLGNRFSYWKNDVLKTLDTHRQDFAKDFQLAREGWNILFAEGKRNVNLAYVLQRPEVFSGTVITRSAEFSKIGGIVEAGDFVTDQLTGSYFVVAGQPPSIEELYNLADTLRVSRSYRSLSVEMGVYENVSLFNGYSVSYGLASGPAGYLVTYAAQPGGELIYAGYSSSAGFGGSARVQARTSYTFLYDLKAKSGF